MSIASQPIHHPMNGLTLRQYYAGLAMQAVIQLGFKADGNADPQFTAVAAWRYADALLLELERTEK